MIDEKDCTTLRKIAETDVLICGGGPAGVGAALSAAREGASVMIVEMLGCLGGMATAGMMSHWVGDSSSKLLSEIQERYYLYDHGYTWTDGNTTEKMYIPQDLLAIVLEEMMRENGVHILYNTIVCDAVTNGNKACGAVIQNKSGRGFIKAKCVIDCTGDGDYAAAAGVPFAKGRDDGKMQPCTLMFKIGGVDYEKAVFPGSFETKVNTPKGELQTLAKKLLPYPAGHILLYRQPEPGTVCVNMTNAVGIDGTDAQSVTEGILTCRSQIMPILRFLREYVPGYEHCWLMSSAALFGVRETRRFEGLESLSAEDVLQAKYYDNWVVRRAKFNFDVHNITGAGLDKTGVQHKFSQKNAYTIPYGCLLPVNVENLLLSGRNISGSHMAHSNYRAMPICMALGEAAGIAAALAVRQNRKLRELDVKEIQARAGK